MTPTNRIPVPILTETVRTNRKGKIVDKKTGEPLMGAHLINQTMREKETSFNYAVTDTAGNFSIAAHADEVIQISYVGYKSLRYAAKNLPEHIEMEEEINELEGVTVSPHKPTPQPTPVTSVNKTTVKPSLNADLERQKKILMYGGLGLTALALLLFLPLKKKK